MGIRWAAVLSLLLSLPASASARPGWTRAKTHYESRSGRVYAVAVGKAKDGQNEALARAAAEERARADLLRFLQKKSPSASAEGQVKGAVPTAFYDAGRGTVYVRLEIDTSGL